MSMPFVPPQCRRGAFAFVTVGILALVGCGPSEEIRSYEAKRNPNDAPTTGGTERFRLLGAIIPNVKDQGGQDVSYFVKFGGAIDQITPYEKAFDDFLASIRIPSDGKDPTYTAPTGWKVGAPMGTRIISYMAPGVGTQPQLYISQPFGGTLLMNVNRWRVDDAGLPAVTEADLPKLTTEVMLDKTKAYKVDFKGPGGKKKKGPFAGGM